MYATIPVPWMVWVCKTLAVYKFGPCFMFLHPRSSVRNWTPFCSLQYDTVHIYNHIYIYITYIYIYVNGVGETPPVLVINRKRSRFTHWSPCWNMYAQITESHVLHVFWPPVSRLQSRIPFFLGVFRSRAWGCSSDLPLLERTHASLTWTPTLLLQKWMAWAIMDPLNSRRFSSEKREIHAVFVCG